MDTDIEMTDVPADHHQDAPGAGRPGLRPPPGFEHLAPAVATDNCSDTAGSSSYMLSQDPNGNSGMSLLWKTKTELPNVQVYCISSPSPIATLPTHNHYQIGTESPLISPAVDPGEPSSSPRQMADRGEDETPVQKAEDPKIRPLRITKIRLKTSSMAADSEKKGSQSSPEDQSGARPSGQSTALSQAATQTDGQGPAGGMFPFPPPISDETDKISSHSEASSASDVDEKEKEEDDEKDDDEDENKENEKPENIIRPSAPVPSHSQTLTYAQLSPHHRLQMLDIMKKKFSDIQEYEKMGIRNIMHLDWAAGNPKDPLNTRDPLGDAGDVNPEGLSDEDRVLHDQLVELVTAFVNDAQGPQRDDEWSKAMFFGDWMQNSTGENMYFVEIQIKRISGADDSLLKRCGINPYYVWLPLAEDGNDDLNLSSSMQGCGNTLPPLVNLPSGGHGDVYRDTSAEPPSSQQSGGARLTLPPIGTFLTPTRRIPSLGDVIRSARERKMNNPEGAVKETAKPPIDPRLETSDSINKPDSASDSKEMATSTDSAEPTGIPRSLPDISMKQSPSWGSTVTTCGDSEDESTSASAIFSNKKSTNIRELLAIQKAAGRRQEKNLEELLRDPAFESRKKNSFVYAVRVVAIPDRCHVLNTFNGPDREERYATLLGSGGWVVPPLEERIKWHNDCKENRPVMQDMPDTNSTGAGKPQVCRAAPICLDWSGSTSPRYYGESAPLWRELADPCLEDVYWMVWQLFAGRQFVGFRSGTGFGQKPLSTRGDSNLVNMCQFKSPSDEALRSSARF